MGITIGNRSIIISSQGHCRGVSKGVGWGGCHHLSGLFYSRKDVIHLFISTCWKNTGEMGNKGDVIIHGSFMETKRTKGLAMIPI